MPCHMKWSRLQKPVIFSFSPHIVWALYPPLHQFNVVHTSLHLAVTTSCSFIRSSYLIPVVELALPTNSNISLIVVTFLPPLIPSRHAPIAIDGTWACFNPFKTFVGPIGGFRSTLEVDAHQLVPYYHGAVLCVNDSAWTAAGMNINASIFTL